MSVSVMLLSESARSVGDGDGVVAGEMPRCTDWRPSPWHWDFYLWRKADLAS
jgi:hypothetical protein